MRLLKCYVAAFGVLRELNIDFSENLNTVFEENGWGKSTLTVFIKSMFYGLKDSKRNISENERLKYKPWGYSESFGGYLDFEHKRKPYRIERYFGNKESDDSFRLTDINTGKEFKKADNIGERIFDIDEEGFFSTIYFSQKDFEIKSNTSITAKFNDISRNSDADALESAVKKIEEKAKLIKGRAEKGYYYDARRDLFAVNDNLEKLNKVSDTVSFMKKELENIEFSVEDLKKQGEKFAGMIAAAGKAEADKLKRETYESFLKEQEVLIKEKENYENFFSGGIPDKGEMDHCISCYRGLFEAQEKENTLSREISELESEKNLSMVSSKKRKALSVSFIIFTLLFILSGFGVMFFSTIVGIILLGFGVIFLILFGISFLKDKKNKSETNFNIQFELSERYAALEECKNKKNRYEYDINIFINKFRIPVSSDIFTALSYIKETIIKYERCVLLLKKNAENIEKYKTELNSANGMTGNTEGLTVLREKLKSVQEEYARKTNERAGYIASVSKYEGMLDSVPELLNEKDRLREKILQYDEDYNILSLTAKFLKEADENLKVKYREPLETSFNKYLSKITNKDGFYADIDVDLKVTVREKSGAKVSDYYSKGYRNIFEICKRFALIDVLFKEEKPFIILDDPFYNLDDDKLDCALNLIKDISEEYQIIYFICHNSRKVS